MSDSEQLCPGCLKKDKTIETLCDIINQSTGPRQTLPSQPNIEGPFDYFSGAYAQPILPRDDSFNIFHQGLPDPMSEQRLLFAASSSNARQATQPGSFTQPSLQATTPTYMSQRETQTETSEALLVNDIDSGTLDMVTYPDHYPLFDDNVAVHGTGSQFKG